MTTDTVNALVLAGLLHDVGKLLERGEIFAEQRRDPFYATVCPQHVKGGLSHLHAIHTFAFCEWLEARFDCLRHIDGTWKYWCAAHHRNDETGAESSVIRISDRLSSSEREEGNYYQRRVHQRTLLEPVLERVFLEEYPENAATTHRYPLVAVNSQREHLFAQPEAALNLRSMSNADDAVTDTRAWTHLLTEEPLTAEYAALGKGLLADVEALAQQCPDLSLNDLILTLMTLLERYTANVPSATNLRHPDISLYDHLRTTAAIAQSFYLYQKDQGHVPTVLPEKDDVPRWLLVCGDFSGIQKFIYNLTNKGAAKGLRGRSFYVGLFCRIGADYLLRELGLHKAGLLYNSGGKFYLLIPQHLKARLYALRDHINAWLLEKFGGDLYFGLGLAHVSAGMFEQGAMHAAWEAAAHDLERDRTRKFKGLLTPAFFEPQTENFDPNTSCSVCGSRSRAREGQKCATCQELEHLGAELRHTGALLTVWGTPDEEATAQLQKISGHPLAFEALQATVWLIPAKQVDRGALKQLRHLQAEVTLLNQAGEKPLAELVLPTCGLSSLYVGKWDATRQVRDSDQRPWDFNDYADQAEGIRRMGVLRMDVDNLGLIFIRGLRFPRRTDAGWGPMVMNDGQVQRKAMASISRMVTLSRQLNHFFSGYVPRLLEQPDFDRCQPIYAGGDDLFIIGSWHQLPLLAERIRSEFKAFCCNNPVFGISGGLILQRSGYPIYKGAQRAGLAEKQAKEVRSQWPAAAHAAAIHKDGFCFMHVPVVWEDFAVAKQIRKLLEADLADDETRRNKGFLAWLAQMTAGNIAAARAAMQTTGASTSDAWRTLQYASWYWRTAYQLRRRYRDDPRRDRWAELLFGNLCGELSTRLPVYTWLEFPLRWAEYLHRKRDR